MIQTLNTWWLLKKCIFCDGDLWTRNSPYFFKAQVCLAYTPYAHIPRSWPTLWKASNRNFSKIRGWGMPLKYHHDHHMHFPIGKVPCYQFTVVIKKNCTWNRYAKAVIPQHKHAWHAQCHFESTLDPSCPHVYVVHLSVIEYRTVNNNLYWTLFAQLCRLVARWWLKSCLVSEWCLW